MSFNTALTSGNYNSLRGTSSASPSHQAQLCLSLCPNTNVFTARVNQVTFNKSFAQITYDGGSGTLANVRVGMTVLISHTNDRSKVFFVGRIRKAPTATLFYINETSAPLVNDDYIFVLDDFRIFDKLARYASSTLYPDYDQAFRQLLPRISNLRGAYAGTASASVLSFDLAPTVAAATDGATISSYLWSVGDGTITAGNSTTKDITVEFPPGFRWIHFTATDSGGRASVRHIPVWVHDDTYPVTLLDHNDLSVTGTIEDGYSGSVTAFDGIDAVLDNTLVCAWLDNEQYNGAATHIVNNVALVGRLRRESSSTSYADGQQDAQTEFEIEGPLQQLARLEITSLQIDNKASPTKFNQVKTLTVWREIHLILTEYTTFHELHSISFDDTTDNFREARIATQAGNLLSVVNALANGINAAIQMNAAGEAEIARDGVMIPLAGRGSLITVANWDKQDILEISLGHSDVLTVGRLEAYGGSYDTTSGKVTVAQSVAPGKAPAYPDGAAQINNQILATNQTLKAAETELNIRAGHALAKAQEIDELTITHPDGYWWLTPSANQWFTFTLDGSETAKEIVLDTSTRWQLVSVSVTHETEAGTRSVEAVYRRETSGGPGQAVRFKAQSSAPLTLPKFPALPAFPIFDIGPFFLPDELTPDIIPPQLPGTMSSALLHDGNTVLKWTGTQVFVCTDFIKMLTPTWREITPELITGEAIVQCRFIPGTLGWANPGMLVMTNLNSVTEINDFIIDDYDWIVQYASGIWQEGVGWIAQYFTDGIQDGHGIIFHRSFPGLVITRVKMYYTVSSYGIQNGAGANDGKAGLIANGVHPTWTVLGLETTLNTGNLTLEWTGSGTFPQLSLSKAVGADTLGAGDPGGDVIITKVEIDHSGSRVWKAASVFSGTPAWAAGISVSDPCTLMRIGETFADVYLFAPTTGKAYYSDDYGVTFADAVVVGTADVPDAGFDTGRLGLVTLAGADTLVRVATTAGGAYSNYTTVPTDTVATAIFIPRYKLSGANNGIGVSAPDFLFASEDPASGTGYTLFKVTAAGATVTNITPLDGATKGLAVGPNCLAVPRYSTAYQDVMAILNFGGTRKLAISVDAGANWVLSGALNAASDFITTRRTDTLRRQLFMTNGPNLIYCSNYRAGTPILATRIGATADTILGLDVLP